MSAAMPYMKMKIDPRNLQIQTHTVEKLLEPLIIQVTTLVNCPQNPSNKKKGCSKRARVILASVEEATWNLLDKGEKIAKEAPVLMEELNAALRDVRKEKLLANQPFPCEMEDKCSLRRFMGIFVSERCISWN